MRPKTANFTTGNARIPPLPLNKTVVDVLSDFLKYLNNCAREYIQEVHPGIGTSVCAGSSEIHYILSHPNGWEGPQQALMKQAAEKAGLIKPGGRNQLSFITEGEASLNTCIEKGLKSDLVQVSLIHALLNDSNSHPSSEGRGRYYHRRWWRNYRYQRLRICG